MYHISGKSKTTQATAEKFQQKNDVAAQSFQNYSWASENVQTEALFKDLLHI